MMISIYSYILHVVLVSPTSKPMFIFINNLNKGHISFATLQTQYLYIKYLKVNFSTILCHHTIRKDSSLLHVGHRHSTNIWHDVVFQFLYSVIQMNIKFQHTMKYLPLKIRQSTTDQSSYNENNKHSYWQLISLPLWH